MIPLKIETLLEGQVVEQNRVEYKEGWNPGEIIHTICAFANDYDNINGGYLVIGVAANEGIPILPPKGVKKEDVDSIQQEIFQYCNKIEPRYIPTIEVVNYPDNDTHLIYLKCSAGDAGPYRAPKDIYSKKGATKSDKTMYYWIRLGSLTTTAKKDEISDLFEKFNSVPFDDRVNRDATILNELKNNGSPMPEFDTDDDRNYLETTIKIHEGFETLINFNQKNERSLSEVLSEVLSKKDFEKVIPIVEYMQSKEIITPREAEDVIGKSPATTRRYMKILLDTGVIETKGKTNNLTYIVKKD